MINTLLGTKKGMTSSYDSRGRWVGATVISMEPNFITQVKSKKEKDGYDGIQLGYSTKKSVKKPQIGHLKKAGIETKVRWMKEVRMDGDPSTALGTIQPGTEIKLDQVFSIGDAVKVTGVSKGKGFQGGVKRHGFHGGPKTHGQSDRHRAPGSIGAGTTPGRVLKGKKMAGHMGVETVSLRGLEVLVIDKENNLLTVKGGVPGSVGGLLVIQKLGRIKGYTPPPQSNAVDTSDVSPEEKLDEPEDESILSEATLAPRSEPEAGEAKDLKELQASEEKTEQVSEEPAQEGGSQNAS